MSTQSIDWKLDEKNPVVRPGQVHGDLDARHAGACHVLDLGDRYRMYYWGVGGQGNTVVMAEAPVERPNDWVPVGGVLIEPQPEAPYNCDGPSFPFVLPLDDTHWMMYFGAWGKWGEDGKLPNNLGLAISDDAGHTWRYPDQSPLLQRDQPWDCSGTGSVSIVKIDGVLRMYYTSIGEYFDAPEGVQTGHGEVIPRIGVASATSTDGIHWTKDPAGLLVAPRGHDFEPYEYINSKPFVMPDGDGYRMWISTFGHAYRIRSLVSPDGITWERVPSGPDGDLGVGAAGTFDDHQRSYASVVKYGDTYRMWYTGNRFGATGIGYAEGHRL